jgi:molybdopterin/thiamine biosynthesis adenylyltransferase
MKRQDNTKYSTLGREVRIRMARPLFDRLASHLCQEPSQEQFAFGLCSHAKAADGTILIARYLFLPGRNELAEQSGGGVAPTRDFQVMVYSLAEQLSLTILDIHTHPHQSVPRFSKFDENQSAENAQYICSRFLQPITHAKIVFDPHVLTHDAVVFDRSLRAFRSVSHLEILGRDTEIRIRGEAQRADASRDPRYCRQTMVPGWDQTTIRRQKIAIVGVGGNGAQILQTLIGIGAGTEGWIAVIDPDTIEASNLPRIPYAYPEHIGSPKVTVAARYTGRKNPDAILYPYPCSVTADAATERIAGATLIIGAGDGEGVRKVCNELAVRYQIPYIDLGCDISVDEGKVAAGGQVRVVVPGSNACLVCCGGYDPGEAAVQLMDDYRKVDHAAHGYVRGHQADATPSVANLNATTAQLGMAAFLALIHGEKFGDWDYAHYDQLSAKTLVAHTTRRQACPLCGIHGLLAQGDVPRAERPVARPTMIRMGKPLDGRTGQLGGFVPADHEVLTATMKCGGVPIPQEGGLANEEG